MTLIKTQIRIAEKRAEAEKFQKLRDEARKEGDREAYRTFARKCAEAKADIYNCENIGYSVRLGQ